MSHFFSRMGDMLHLHHDAHAAARPTGPIDDLGRPALGRGGDPDHGEMDFCLELVDPHVALGRLGLLWGDGVDKPLEEQAIYDQTMWFC